jgi:hypothetical protein
VHQKKEKSAVKNATDVARFVDRKSRQNEAKLNVGKLQNFRPGAIKENMKER